MPKILIFEYIGIIIYVLVLHLIDTSKGEPIDKSKLLEKIELASFLFILMGAMCTISTYNLK